MMDRRGFGRIMSRWDQIRSHLTTFQGYIRAKKVFYCLLITLVLVFSCLITLNIYITRLEFCKGEGWPIPPPAILGFGSYYMVTDQGRLYVGQTYEHRNEGPQVGNLTLLYLDGKGATFLLRIPEVRTEKFEVHECKIFFRRAPENYIGN